MHRFLQQSATEHAELLAAGDLSCEELTKFYLERAERYNSQLHAFTYISKRRSLATARKWDSARIRGTAPKSPLSGVPTGVKDLFPVKFMPLGFGSRAFRYVVSPIDVPMVTRMRDAGMIITGKLSTSEFGAIPFTEPEIHDPTRNPWDVSRTAGGSSGGSGAAVAAGLLPIAQGSDGGGSIRIPSALCHLVGFKPSRGILLQGPAPDRDIQLSVIGPLARSVRDAAAMFDLFCESHGNYLAQVEQQPKKLRVAVSTSQVLTPTDPELIAATEKAAKLLEELGADVQTTPWVDIELDEFLILWCRLMAIPWIWRESLLQPITQWLRARGRTITTPFAVEKRAQLAQQVTTWFGEEFDLRLSPTVATLPPLIGSWRSDNPEESFRRVIALGAYTAVYNVGGNPAISIPLGISSQGLPLAVQLAGKVGQDALVLQVARAIEKRVGGFIRYPKAFGGD